MKTAFGSVVLLASLGLTAACGGGASSHPPPANVSIQISPTSFNLGLGSNLQFVATVTGTTDTSAAWQVNGMPGGDASLGTITGAGLYIAPVNMPAGAITVTAVANADSTRTSSASLNFTATDPVGTAQGASITCKQGKINTSSACYSVDLSCPGVADFTAYLKVTSPTGTSIGTVMLTGGGNGTGFYEDYTYGDTTVNNVVAAGFTAVQTSFGGPFTSQTPDGWQTGPGGIRRLACRYATLANWVYANVHQASTSKPMCATGNSSGGQLIAETLAHYGTDSIFSMVEPTSGPPFSDMEKSCICGQDAEAIPRACYAGTGDRNINQCLDVKDAQKYVDPAYSSPICSNDITSHSTSNQAEYISDTIQSPDAKVNYPHTYVHFLYGGLDTSSAVTLGPDYMSVITSSKSQSCVADAPHSIADVLDGAQQVASDIVAKCQLY